MWKTVELERQFRQSRKEGDAIALLCMPDRPLHYGVPEGPLTAGHQMTHAEEKFLTLNRNIMCVAHSGT